MMGAKQMKFCEAVARALLIGVKFDGLNGVQIGSGSKMGKLQMTMANARDLLFWYNNFQPN
jgi:hypothetical protein